MEIMIVIYAVSALLNIALAVAMVYNLADTRRVIRIHLKRDESWRRDIEKKVRGVNGRVSMLEGRYDDDRK